MLSFIFISKKVINTGWSKVVKEQHIRFSVSQHNVTIAGIGFNMAGKFELLNQKKPIDIVYTIDNNEWNGNSALQIRVIDFRLSE